MYCDYPYNTLHYSHEFLLWASRRPEGAFQMDWNLSNLRPVDPTSILLPAGANMGVAVSMEPESKEVLIIQAIRGAKASIWTEMYTFTDNTVALELARAGGAHIDVQVLYEPRLPQVALQQLSPDKQQFPPWATPNKAVLPNQQPVNTRHAKFMIIDGGISGQEQAYIMTANFTQQALGGGSSTAQRINREYVVCDTNPQDIGALRTIFQQDKQGQLLPPINAPNLIVSSINAHSLLWKLLTSAKQQIWIQTEELNDPDSGGPLAQSWSIEGALIAAAQRGVAVEMMLPPQNTGDWITPDSSAALTRLKGVPNLQIKTGSQYYMHAKLIVVDQTLAFVGSQNLGRAALNYNREVGLLISSGSEVQKLCATFAADWAQASH
jgi:phosphatidylserine/phosphatidylglycerophosphate/cardiolipin synthase-like enzyme